MRDQTHILLRDVLLEGERASTDRLATKLVTGFRRRFLANDIATVVIGHAAKERGIRIFERDAHGVIVQRFNLFNAGKAGGEAGALWVGRALNGIHYVFG